MEVRRLRERTVDARRGHLERIALAERRQLVRDALAQLQRDALGVVDEEANRVPRDLGEQHLDARLGGRELGFDVGLELLVRGVAHVNKKSRGGPLFGTTAWP